MNSFKKKYLDRCAELSITPITELANFKEYENENLDSNPLLETLNLSGISLSLKSCSALSSALSDTSCFTKLVLADSFLGDDGCIKIVSALKTNPSIIHLDLRGNSIRSEGAAALGSLLKVNSKLEHLYLEWNCLGIWDSGIKSIAESLSINETLQTLDLRNNKIGPQSAQHLAQCLKHNTSLKKLDLRWNNSGLLGGRAFSDLLQWNKTLIELELVGNEIPDDIGRSIAAALDRNRDRFNSQLYAKAHSETLASTIQNLSQSHQEALINLQSRYAKETYHCEDLQGQLQSASSEIHSMQEAYRMAVVKVERLEKEYQTLEELLVKERNQLNDQLNTRHRDLNTERDARSKAEQIHQKTVMELNERFLSLDAGNKKTTLELESLKSERVHLQEELNAMKERERKMADLWTEKFERLNLAHSKKQCDLQDAMERDFKEKSNRFLEKIRALELDLSKTEQENSNQKSKFILEKRQWLDSQSELELRLRNENHSRTIDLETSIKNLNLQIENLRETNKKNIGERKELEAELGKLREEKRNIQDEISQLHAQGMKHAHELRALKAKLEETKATEVELMSKNAELTRLHDDLTNERAEKEKVFQSISQKDETIQKLKGEIKRRDIELDTKDEETALRMKELQISIGALLNARSKPRRPDVEL